MLHYMFHYIAIGSNLLQYITKTNYNDHTTNHNDHSNNLVSDLKRLIPQMGQSIQKWTK